MELAALLMLVFISVFAAVYFILLAISRRSDPVLERFRYVESLSGSLQEQYRSMSDSDRKKLNPKVIRMFGDMAKHLKKDDSRIRRNLLRAGYHRENGVQLFYGMKVFLPFLLIGVYTVAVVLRHPGPIYLFAVFPIGLFGYLLPNFVLSIRINQRRDAINGGLPDALDFLVVCVEAGLGLNAALVRVGKEMGMKCRELSEEFLLVNQEMRTGLSREQAFHNLAERNGSKHLRVLVSAIVLSDRLGTNIADTLRAQSDSLRVQFRQQAEEQAAKAGIKMLFPLVFFILPTLFIVILGPAIILVVQELFPVMNK